MVGEVSGDNLGFQLIRALRKFYPDLSFEGVLGPQLLKEGGNALYPMDRLSVMGLIEPLARLPEILKIRRHLIQYFAQNPPDLFIGIDAPDFNLSLEKTLKSFKIPTVHYVSPSVWAWRQGRIKTIQKAVDLMLTLLPFEARFYEEHQVPVCYTGHPIAEEIAFNIDKFEARNKLNCKSHTPLIALLPGSRNNEIKYLAETFIQTAKLCFEEDPSLEFVTPLVSIEHKERFEALQARIAPNLPNTIIVNDARTAMAAADAVLVTSGTATLEVMLHKKPMVVAYRMHPLTYFIAKRLIKVPYIALPNLLAQECLVPEFIQEKAEPRVMAKSLMSYLKPSFNLKALVNRFDDLHQILKAGGSETAARAIHELLNNPSQIVN